MLPFVVPSWLLEISTEPSGLSLLSLPPSLEEGLLGSHMLGQGLAWSESCFFQIWRDCALGCWALCRPFSSQLILLRKSKVFQVK